MKLNDRVVEGLAEMVVGDHDLFPNRSSSYITRFFERCGLPFVHDGSTRKWWAKERLAELNLGVCYQADLPADDLLTVISELLEPDDFEKANAHSGSLITVDAALEGLNKLLKRQGLVAYLHESGKCFLRNAGSGVDSVSTGRAPRPLSKEETEQRERLKAFLDSASEDEFTERVLVPLFQRLGFHRVSMAGHVEKTLEFGKDLWMKYQLPTSHWLYFCVQVKRDKIDSTGSSGGKNVSTVLTQARMAIDHPIFDPEANTKVRLDHIYIISANEITRAARNWIIENLDAGQRRHIIFMDRTELLDQSARILLDLHLEEERPIQSLTKIFRFSADMSVTCEQPPQAKTGLEWATLRTAIEPEEASTCEGAGYAERS